MKNILLPTDFSENSLNAIDYALKFFKGVEVNFYVLNVQKTSEYTTSDMMASSATTTVYQAVLDDNRKMLKSFISKLRSKNASDSFTFHALIDYDVFTDAINQAVQKNKIDLIVMGTNGATGAREAIFGSNTLKVIREIHCPVLAIPENYKFLGVNSLLFSNDSSEDFSISGVQPLIQILSMHQPSLSILELNATYSDTEENQHSCSKDLFEAFDYKYYKVENVPVAMAINTAIQLFNFDFHALFLEQKSFIDRFFFGSDDNKISYGTQIPLLVMHK